MPTDPVPARLWPVRLSLTNFQNLAAFNLQVSDKRLTLITGPNGAGKTTILTAFDAALRGKNACPKKAIKIGEHESIIRLVLRDELAERYEAVRSIRHNQDGDEVTDLNVYDISGDARTSVPKPQTMLNDLTNVVAFRPAEIMTPGADRLKLLLHAIGRQSDYARNRQEHKALYDGRTQTNKDVVTLDAQLKAKPNPDASQTLKRIDNTEAASALRAINRTAEDRTRMAQNQVNACDKQRDLRERIIDLQKQVHDLELEHTAAENLEADCGTYLANLGEVDTEAPAKELQRIEQHNANVAVQQDHRELAVKLTSKRTEAETQSAELHALDGALAEMVTSSTIGQQIPGLSMDGSTLQFQGHPFDQASGRQQRELAMHIGMAANPTLRVSIIDEADGIDDEGLEHFAQLAEANDMVLFFAGTRLPEDVLADVAQHVKVDAAVAGLLDKQTASTDAPVAGTTVPLHESL